jgi:hypothetical protein
VSIRLEIFLVQRALFADVPLLVAVLLGGHNDQQEIRSRNGVRAARRLRDIAATAGVNLSPIATVAAAPAHAMQHHERRRWPSLVPSHTSVTS